MTIFKGSGVALVTPFKNGGIDYKSLKNLIDFQINNNTDAIIICGTTGESATLSYQEHINCIKKCIEYVNGRTKVIAGTGSNCTKSAVELSKKAEQLGADGVLVVTPYYNKATQKGLVAHYSKIAQSINIPLIMYNVPSRTGVNIEPETVIEIAKQNKNVCGIKEASGNISQIAYLSYLKEENNVDLDIYSGNDDQVLPVLSLGGVGVISVNANIIPEETHAMVESYFKGDLEKAKLLQTKATAYSNVLFSEVNPIPIKRALYEKKLISSPELRYPLTNIENKNLVEVQKILKKYK